MLVIARDPRHPAVVDGGWDSSDVRAFFFPSPCTFRSISCDRRQSLWDHDRDIREEFRQISDTNLVLHLSFNIPKA